jgi:putative FmdB family regulatory protein
MPTYEYACAECGNQWEEVQKITEPAVEVCPKCHKKSAHRQISGGNFILKGGGWYSDLYSSSPKKADTKDSSDSSGGKSASKGDKAEAKSEAKAEKKDASGPTPPAAPATPAATGGTKT